MSMRLVISSAGYGLENPSHYIRWLNREDFAGINTRVSRGITGNTGLSSLSRMSEKPEMQGQSQMTDKYLAYLTGISPVPAGISV
jgi:hypothetical protein